MLSHATADILAHFFASFRPQHHSAQNHSFLCHILSGVNFEVFKIVTYFVLIRIAYQNDALDVKFVYILVHEFGAKNLIFFR